MKCLRAGRLGYWRSGRLCFDQQVSLLRAKAQPDRIRSWPRETALLVSTFVLRHSFGIGHSFIGHLPKAWLFDEGREQRDEAGNLIRRGLDRKTVRKVIEGGGKLSRAQLLRCRVRYFSAGVAIGGKSFVEGVFKARRDHFGPKRKDGARPIKESDSGLCSLRALRVQAIE